MASTSAAKIARSRDGEEDFIDVEDGVAATRRSAEEEGGRERLKRLRREMAGRVWIPEAWGHEKHLAEWSDCVGLDSALFPAGLMPAREALVEECKRRTTFRRVTVESSC